MRLFSIIALLLLFCLDLSAQAFPDRHSTSYTDGWMSCQISTNPNAKERDDSHWIMYDLGTTYALSKSTIWNVNSFDFVNNGMQDVVIDYSIDGETWIEWGNFTMDQGPISAFYEGDEGPDFSGVIARYVLITGITNYGGACYGLSEIRIDATNVVVSDTDDVLDDVELIAAPNPFSDLTQISINAESGAYTYMVTDGLGREVASGNVSVNGDEGSVSFNASELQSGVYAFTLIKDKKAKTILLQVVK